MKNDRTIYSDKRKSGISLIGDVPWGTTFCHFYQNHQDQIDILIPYFEAGLKNNEVCVWVISESPGLEEAREALEKALPHYQKYRKKGQIEIVSYKQWQATGDKAEKGLSARIDNAISSGFDSLRLAFSYPEKRGKNNVTFRREIDDICRHTAIAIFAYPRDSFDAVALMEVVKEHRCALIRNADRWEVIESSEVNQVKAALRRSELFYHSLFDNMLEGYAYCHMIFKDGQPEDFVYLAVNNAFEKLTGLKDVVGKKVSEVIPGIKQSNPELLEIYGRVALTGQPHKFETYLEPLQLWLSISVYSPEKGTFTAVFDNITERKKAESTNLRRTAVVQAINHIFREAYACDTKEALGISCLRIIEGLTQSKFGFMGEIGADGFLHDTAMSNPGWRLCTMYDKSGHRRPPGNFQVHGLYGRVLLDGKSLLSNDPASHPDSIGIPAGHPPLKAFLGVPLIYGGKTTGMIGLANKEGGYTNEDLEAAEALAPAIVEATMHKYAEQELKQYARLLEASNKELESFSYTVSHDLRAPLRSMDGFSSALLEDYGDKLDAEGREWLTRIRASSQNMAHLIDDILKLSRVVRAEIKIEDVCLSDLAQSVARELSTAQPERKVEFKITPGLETQGDENLLRILLTNLLGNAFKFTAKCQNALIEFGITEIDGQKHYFVRDNGAGFDMTYANKLFKPFQRLHDPQEYPGTGIGLATVQRIIERHGGKITAEGRVGQGSTFYFSTGQE